MMKKLSLVFFGLFLSFQNICAQSYTVQSTPYLPYPFGFGTQLTLSDDQYSPVIPLGFDFCFFGQAYNEILISSNSYVTFNTASAGGYSPWSISDSIPDSTHTELFNSIMFPWQDILPPSGGIVSYAVYGEVPCRKFVVSYFQVAMFSCTTIYFTNQLVLHEGSNVIETFIENKPVCSAWNGGQAIHGLQNGTGTEAVIIPGRNAGTLWEAYYEGFRFIPLTCEIDTNDCSYLNDTTYTLITGKLFTDDNNNCLLENGEDTLVNRVITTVPGGYSGWTNLSGVYNILVYEPGTYQLDFDITTNMQLPQCGQNQIFVPANGDTIHHDLMMEPLECSDINISIHTTGYVACDTVLFEVALHNNGTIESGNTTLFIQHFNQISIVGSNYNYSVSGDSIIIHLPGGLQSEETIYVSIEAIVSCNSKGDICLFSWANYQSFVCPNALSNDEECLYDVTSTEENAFKKLLVYPNPSSGQITISGNTKPGDCLHLIDVTGRLLRSYLLNEKFTTLDISEILAGFYTFSITDSRGNLTGNGKIQIIR